MSASTAPESPKKVDYKKDFKWLYLPKEKPELVEVPELLYLTIDGSGSPDAPAFSEAVEALYALSYAVKMSYKSASVPDGYYEYTVFPLEGVWDLMDYSVTSLDRDNFKYTLMIRQPDFLTPALYERFLTEAGKKKPGLPLSRVTLTTLTEGTCCQMLHLGSYANEPASFSAMEAFCEAQGWVRALKSHREIYLSDPRKTETAKLKTVLRFQVVKFNTL